MKEKQPRLSGPFGVVLAMEVAILLHLLANGIGVYVVSISQAQRVSIAAHALAWILHRGFWEWTCRRSQLFSGVGLWLWVLEVLVFLPVPVTLLGAITGFSGPLLWSEGYAIIYADSRLQLTLIFMTGPMLFTLTYMRINTVRLNTFQLNIIVYQVMLAVPISLFAYYPNVLVMDLFTGLLFSLFIFSLNLVLLSVMVWTMKDMVTTNIPSFVKPTVGIVLIWVFVFPGVVWDIPGFRSLYDVIWLSKASSLSGPHLLNKWLKGDLKIVSLRRPDDWDAEFCAQIRCEADCSDFMNGEEKSIHGVYSNLCKNKNFWDEPKIGPVKKIGDLGAPPHRQVDLIPHETYVEVQYLGCQHCGW